MQIPQNSFKIITDRPFVIQTIKEGFCRAKCEDVISRIERKLRVLGSFLFQEV
jgi:hypothetical protein